jgi:hypothetical protein
MRNSKPPKRPAGMTPAMERNLRAQAPKIAANRRNESIEEVYPEMGAMGAKAGLGALGRYMARAAAERKAIDSFQETLIKGIKSINTASREMGLRGAVRPVNSKEIADMARRYAEKDKSVLQDIGKLTQRQQQMVRDEIARQYRKVTPMDKVKTIAKKIDKKLDPANTGRTGAIGIGVDETTTPKTVQLQEVEIMKPKKYAAGGSLKPVPAGKKGLAKLPTEVRNKMGYMMGGGKLDMMYAKGGKLKKPGAPNPLNPTKDNNSYISNAVDMSPAVKKQMDALRQAMMYFTGVSPKNK